MPGEAAKGSGDGEAPVEPKPAAKKTEPTEYIVLELDGSGLWDRVGGDEDKVFKAIGTEKAIDVAVGEREGTFVAIPKRSWRPMTFKNEVITKRKAVSA